MSDFEIRDEPARRTRARRPGEVLRVPGARRHGLAAALTRPAVAASNGRVTAAVAAHVRSSGMRPAGGDR